MAVTRTVEQVDASLRAWVRVLAKYPDAPRLDMEATLLRIDQLLDERLALAGAAA